MFNVEKGQIPMRAARRYVRDALIGQMNGTSCHPSGGIFFVSRSEVELLGRWAQMVNSLDGCQMHVLPLLDTDDQRSMVRNAFTAECKEEVARVLAEIAEVLKSDNTITADRANSYYQQVRSLSSKIGDYATMLEQNLGEAEAELELMKLQVLAVFQKVDVS
jgi:hypothetical protein